jgi:hypothetical protein
MCLASEERENQADRQPQHARNMKGREPPLP